jgi:glycosyltransferase involved in cell wall biosynthesis
MNSSSGPGSGFEETDPIPSSGGNRPRTEINRQWLPGVFLMIESFETGGSERQFAALARSLNPQAFRLSLGCIRQRGAFVEGLGELPQFRLGGSLYGLQSLRTRFRLIRHLRKTGIAVAQAFDFYSNLTLIPSARLAGVSVVVGSQRQLGDLLTAAQTYVQTCVFRWCDAIVCNSRAAARRLLEQGLAEEKVVVIGNGLPASAFAETPCALPRSTGLLRVGMIARMNTRAKNHGTFLRAAARLRDKFQSLEFVLVGDGPLRPELEREAESLGLAGQVRFLGDRRDIAAILASLDVSVLPSASESLSNVILESMAAGVPVVASQVGGNPELITKDRGILFAPENVDEAVAAVEALLRDPARRAELGSNARRFVQANFSAEGMGARYEELYAELLARKRWQPHPRSFVSPAFPGNPARLRVAIVAASLRYVGGQSVQADLLLRHWKDDPEIEARLIAIDPILPRAVAWVERIPVLRTLVRQPFYVWNLWRGFKDVDMVHIFSASYWSFLIAPAPALLVARLRNKRAIIHYHSGEARDHLRRFRSARPVLRQAARLVVPSGYLVDVFREFGLQARVVPNIVDEKQFSFRERRPTRPHLICTRGFHPYYSVDVVVRAFAEIQNEFPEARLDLVGTGPSEAEIRNLVRDLQVSGVRFLGVASREQIGDFYDDADIFVNASWLDNMPVSIMEAFASGNPVVTTDPEGIRYLVEHEGTGLLSQVGDAKALARNVMRLLRDPDLSSRLASNAYKESQSYRWTTVRQQWLDEYRSVVSGSAESAQQLAVTR